MHVRDTATLFRPAPEEAPAGPVPHAVADEGAATRGIAAVTG
ncbi:MULTISPECIES: hypothetical protein [unclassified Streptomyces]